LVPILTSEEDFSNQCLFVRTLNATLSNEAWKELNDSLGLPNVLDSNLFSRTTFLQTPPRPRGRTFSTTIDTQQMSPDTPTSGSQRSLHPLHNIDNEHDEKGLRFSTTPDFDVVHHPSDGLNKLLLKKFPNVRMVVTLDGDWCSGIKEGERDMPDPHQLWERITSSHNIRMEDGILFLERKEIQGIDTSESSDDETEDIDTWKTKEGAPSPSHQRFFSELQETRTSCSNCQKMRFKCLPPSVEDEERCQQCVNRDLKCEPIIGKGLHFRVSPKQGRMALAAKGEEPEEVCSRSGTSHGVVSKNVGTRSWRLRYRP